MQPSPRGPANPFGVHAERLDGSAHRTGVPGKARDDVHMLVRLLRPGSVSRLTCPPPLNPGRHSVHLLLES
ncbi:hypothetical protein AB0395_05480 [Streptosporangium sp. NPDC051023]|uniref:hypothetical protein n=1 Tax=Streptosporangium sp. NPDC051023 TaxID=3155410 RepID=UPI00344FC069